MRETKTKSLENAGFHVGTVNEFLWGSKMRIFDLDQNSPDWAVWRNGGLGASDAPALLGVSPWKSPGVLLKEKRAALGLPYKGVLAKPRYSDAMRRGHELEPEARELAAGLLGIACEPVCCAHDELPWLLASLDGWDAGGIITEIKCPNSEAHAKALDGEVPEYYLPQLVHQCLVTGARRVAYVSYSPDREFRGPDRLALVPVAVPEGMVQAYRGQAVAFWGRVTA